MRDDLPHAMRETARRLEPDVVRLATGGVSRGTRMRRVERAAQVLGSAVAVAVVFAGVALFAQHRAPGVAPGTGSGGGGANQPTETCTNSSSSMSGSHSPSNFFSATAGDAVVPTASEFHLIKALKQGLDDRTDLIVTLVRADGSGLTALEINAPTEKSTTAIGPTDR